MELEEEKTGIQQIRVYPMKHMKQYFLSLFLKEASTKPETRDWDGTKTKGNKGGNDAKVTALYRLLYRLTWKSRCSFK